MDTFLKIVLLPPSPGARVVDATSRASGSPGPLTPRFAPRMGSRMQTIRASSRRGPGALSAGAGPQTTVYNCLGGMCGHMPTWRQSRSDVRIRTQLQHYSYETFNCVGSREWPNMLSMRSPSPSLAVPASPVRNSLLAAVIFLASACGSSGPGGEQPCSSTVSCPTGQVCVSGIDFCVVPKGCVQGDICGATCTNTKEDPANCGTCGTVCSGATPFCANKVCAASCPPGLIACNGGCVDFAKDVRNCGSCGHTCGLLQACESGVCVNACNAPLGDCGGVCLNLQDDEANCGACNHICPSTSPLCSQGTCVASCPSTLVLCGRSCVNFATDPWNCGGCGQKCDPGETCQSGVCK